MAKLKISDERAGQYTDNPILFLEDNYTLPETRLNIKLQPFQKDWILGPLFYDLDDKGLRKYNIALLGMPKKNGKSALAAGLALFFMYCDEPFGEIIVAANDKDQASMIIYNKIRRSIMINPTLKRGVRAFKDVIEVLSTGTTCQCIAHQYSSAAGLNPNLTLFDEIWGFKDRKFYDELTVVPTRRNPLIVIVTYAGYEQEGLLWDLYEDGINGSPILDTGDPEIVVNRGLNDPKMFFFWSNKNMADWITEEYLMFQRGRMPPPVYARLHENRWTRATSEWVTEADIRGTHSTPWLLQTEPRTDKPYNYIVATDLGLSHDRAARVVGHYDPDDGKVYIDNMRLWQGSPDEHVPIKEVEEDLVECATRFRARSIVADPWQMEYVIQRLGKGMYNIVPFNFSLDLLHLSQLFVNMLRSRRIVSYEEPALDAELRDTVIKQTAQGWRIDHKKKKVNDLVISLGMMMVEAVRVTYGSLILPGSDEFRQAPISFAGIRGKEF